MANTLVHFAIHADNIARARTFYGKVFAWDFQQYGPSDFFQIKHRDGSHQPVLGALESRKYNPAEKDMIGYECSISVDDVDATAAAVVAAGGKILMEKTAIPTVGWIIKFEDTEGNVACAINFDSAAH
ncbi:VOC family protein [Nitrospirillum amazonense]|uniref:VOC family protein n=1 Tax=Nitrospirillum amazonense TaxID=28077 RepID=UPI00119DC0C7|nr:VOC family protein [Nitrospirillum amazonense]